MAKFVARPSGPEDGRFCNNVTEVLVGTKLKPLAGNEAIINAITNSTKGDIPALMRGLQEEMTKDETLKDTWIGAEGWFEADKSLYAPYKRPNVPKELHIALIAYVLDSFFEKFNAVTRNLKSVAEVSQYPYKNFFKLLLLAVVRVTGQPEGISINTKLYRGLKGGKLHAAVGSEIAIQQFSSTSRSREVGDYYAGDGERTLLIIENIMPSGLDSGKVLRTSGCPNIICLDHISPSNQECLLWPCEIFKVTRVEDESDGLRIIYLKA